MQALWGRKLPFRTRLISASVLNVKFNLFLLNNSTNTIVFSIIIYITIEYNYALLYSRSPYSCCHAILLHSKKCCVTKATPCSTPISISFLYGWIRVTRALGTRLRPFSPQSSSLLRMSQATGSGVENGF